jgi:hypothetical protein
MIIYLIAAAASSAVDLDPRPAAADEKEKTKSLSFPFLPCTSFLCSIGVSISVLPFLLFHASLSSVPANHSDYLQKIILR